MRGSFMLKKMFIIFSIILHVTGCASDSASFRDADGTINLIQNESFESPALQHRSWKLLTSIPGWRTDNNYRIEIQNNVAGKAFHGSQHIELDSNKNTCIRQKIPTMPGSTYQISFFYSARPGTKKNDSGITVKWNNKIMKQLAVPGKRLIEWNKHAFNIESNDASGTLEFCAAGKSNSLGAYLDMVSMIKIQ